LRNLLVLTPYAVVPPNFGGAVRAYNLCRALARTYRVEQFAQQVTRENVAPRLDPVVREVAPGYTEYSPRDPLSILLYGLTSIALRCQPIWNSAALSLTAPPWLRRRIAAADIVQVVQPWQFAWARRHARPGTILALDTQNVESRLFTAETIAGPRQLARALAGELARQEYRAVRAADVVFAVSQEDADALARRCDTPPERFVIAPNGVDCERYLPVPPQLRAERKRALGLEGRAVVAYAGSRFGPSVEAARMVLGWARDWPDPEVAFLVVGTAGDAFRPEEHPRARFTGLVEDTRPYLEAADVALNPVLTGSGTNLKQLEYMALGLPTLLTPVGARGLPLEDGVHGLIAAPDELPRRLAELLAAPELRGRLGRAGRLLVERRFDWRAVAQIVAAAYERLRGAAERPAP
jgi:glycosyltransferase involved in cell wall biosynthesis